MFARQIQSAQRKEIISLMDSAHARARSEWAYYSSVGSHLPKRTSRILELGCGPGKFAAMFAALGGSVCAVDPFSFPTWADIQATFPTVEFKSGVYAEALPFEDEAFDCVTCLAALLYFTDPCLALREMKRTLKENGRLIIRTVNRTNLYTSFSGKKMDPASKNLYTMDELVELCRQAGFRIIHKETYGFWMPVFSNFWWYLTNVAIPYKAHNFLSQMTPESYRTNLTVVAEKGS